MGGGDASVPPSRQTFGEKTSRERTVSGVLAVILSAAKDLCVRRARPFAEFTLSEANGLRVTGVLSRCLSLYAVSHIYNLFMNIFISREDMTIGPFLPGLIYRDAIRYTV